MKPQTAPFGSWSSLLSTDLLTTGSSAVTHPYCDGDNCYWLESRPLEKGRNTLMEKTSAGHIREVLPSPFSIRSTVHEYGGSSYIVINGLLYFCLEDDQRIYRLNITEPSDTPIPITPDSEGMLRYADLDYDPVGNRLFCVCEDHSSSLHDDSQHSSSQEPENFIAAIALPDAEQDIADFRVSEPVKLISGDDFYAYPRISPDGTQLTWISWQHPDMPWDNTRLWLSAVDKAGTPGEKQLIAGGDDTAIFQPQWSPDNQLYYVSDDTNWWNIYRYNPEGNDEILCEMAAEFATPLWSLGMSTYGFLDANTIFGCYTQNSIWHIGLIDVNTKTLQPIASDFTQISNITCHNGGAYFVAGNAQSSNSIYSYSIHQAVNQKLENITEQPDSSIPVNYLSQPDYYQYRTAEDSFAHLLYYPPTNPEFCGPDDELPPLIVICHGGPTGMSSPQLNFKIQYWTSRGFAVADINYRGSTGFGRDYRDSLHYQWGIADVEDAVNGAGFLIEKGLADAERTIIRGSSAGGYTVLAALAFTDFFKAGACLYGIGDLETLAKDTHKFESRYLDKLIGKYPQEQALYQQRSPIHHADNINCPVIFFQGMDDKVVPPQQTINMRNLLSQKKIPVACLLFEGEAHGFRKAKTIEDSMQAELYFYAVTLGFPVPEDCPAIAIENL